MLRSSEVGGKFMLKVTNSRWSLATRRICFALLIGAATAAVLAGCGGTRSVAAHQDANQQASTTPPALSSITPPALSGVTSQFQACLVAHGYTAKTVPNLLQKSSLNSIPPQVLESCQTILNELIPPLTPSQEAKYVNFVSCMRLHGIPALAPVFGPAGSVTINLGPTGGPGNPTFVAARAVCLPLMAGG